METTRERAQETVCAWTVSGMDCASCAAKIQGAVERLPGVREVSVGVMSERLRLKLDESATSRAEVEAAVTALGYAIERFPAKPEGLRVAKMRPNIN